MAYDHNFVAMAGETLPESSMQAIMMMCLQTVVVTYINPTQ
jgi:hypothetical protein